MSWQNTLFFYFTWKMKNLWGTENLVIKRMAWDIQTIKIFLSKRNTFTKGQKLKACWLFTHCTHLDFFQPCIRISFYLTLIFWQITAWCLWGLEKYVLQKADSKFLFTYVLYRLYRQHNKNRREGEKVEKSRVRLSDLKLLTSEPEERSDQFPFFFLEATARPSFMEQALPCHSHLPLACWGISLPNKASNSNGPLKSKAGNSFQHSFQQWNGLSKHLPRGLQSSCPGISRESLALTLVQCPQLHFRINKGWGYLTLSDSVQECHPCNTGY